jgi:predicted RNA binding protein YcfA (HicA-like mRNA interferase family)
MNPKKILKKILEGNKNIRFEEMVALIQSYEFYLSRTSGSHHIFVKHEFDEIINLQNVKGKAKPYQVNQFLKIIERYNLKMKDGE